ncbi:MAG: DUF1819 family protein [SAR324 cluster bacterium]|nr:DUF1819 family protein [SAR324 cluster bacterium]
MSGTSLVYSANITAGSSLMLMESRQVARLLLNQSTPTQWHQAIVVDNVLQKRSPETAKRVNRLLRSRLTLMKPELWQLIVEGNTLEATQALLACAIKHSRLLGDFLEQVIKENLRVFKYELSQKDWKEFLETCEQQVPEMGHWSESTRQKLGQVIFSILAEARFIEDIRHPVVKPIQLVPEVLAYLKKYQEDYVLRCMDIGSHYTK